MARRVSEIRRRVLRGVEDGKRFVFRRIVERDVSFEFFQWFLLWEDRNSVLEFSPIFRLRLSSSLHRKHGIL
jgi:hypothetical protein